MKILWITNIVFPEAQVLLNGKGGLSGSGGWMLGAANALIKQPDVELFIAAPYKSVSSLTKLQGHSISYFLFPLGKGNLKKNDEYRKYWRTIHDIVMPDVVHIHGTEFSHGLAYVDECGADNVVVSVQGLTSEIAKYYALGLSKFQILRNMSLGDVFRGSVFSEVRRYRNRGKFEIELIKKVNHIIGRTSFDRSHIWAINPNAKYHFCNETLREDFYTGKWKYETCIPYSIFFSQANCPLKGLHFLLEALTIVKNIYPNVRLNIAGTNITKHNSTLRGIYAYSGYGKLIGRYIKNNGLSQNVEFTGPLSAGQMKASLLNSNIFVCSSTIENSPNSLAEAQMLGVPCVASFVGGTHSLIPNESCGILYRCEDIQSLAYCICELFRNSDSFDNSIMIKTAQKRHSPILNTEQLLTIYKRLS